MGSLSRGRFYIKFLFSRGFRAISTPDSEPVGRGGSESVVSDFILLLFSASGGVRKGEKGVNFEVILVNPLSGATEWSDRDGTNFIGKRNVPALTY